jgi:hypothetical protein
MPNRSNTQACPRVSPQDSQAVICPAVEHQRCERSPSWGHEGIWTIDLPARSACAAPNSQRPVLLGHSIRRAQISTPVHWYVLSCGSLHIDKPGPASLALYLINVAYVSLEQSPLQN